MYIPAAFAEPNLGRLHDFIEQYSFGLIVSQIAGQPFATHLPLLLERDAGRQGTLVGHVARANPHWQAGDDHTVLAVFSGPHAYISPTWYETANVVPTWNYVAVHALGKMHIIDDEPTLLEIVSRLAGIYESAQPQPWSVAGESKFIERLLPQIVGFRIPIDVIEGKWKLNQNHPVERREKVARALGRRGDENSLAIAELMQAMLRAEPAATGEDSPPE